MTGEQYDEAYFERGIETGVSLYERYRWLSELTIPLAFRLIEGLGLKPKDTILDFGTAKGYLVKALRLLGRQAYGADISEYALDHAPPEVKQYLFRINSDGIIPTPAGGKYDWVIAKDSVEHVPHERIDAVLKQLAEICRYAFFAIPLGENGRYVIPAYEQDVSHVIREPMAWWRAKLEAAGFTVHEATYRWAGLKDNWGQYSRGNGFFRLSSGGCTKHTSPGFGQC